MRYPRRHWEFTCRRSIPGLVLMVCLALVLTGCPNAGPPQPGPEPVPQDVDEPNEDHLSAAPLAVV